MAAGSIAGSLGSQSPKSKPLGLSAPVIIGKDGKPYIPDNQERKKIGSDFISTVGSGLIRSDPVGSGLTRINLFPRSLWTQI